MLGRNKSAGFAVLSIILLLAAGLVVSGCGGGAALKPAKVYKVTFEASGGEPVPEAQLVEAGSKIELPKTMARTKFTFSGWYKDLDCKEPWDFAKDTVESDIILFANWKSTAGKSGGGGGSSSSSGSPGGGPGGGGSVTSFTVTFDGNDQTSGSPPAAQTVNSGSSLTLPDNATMANTGYTFAGWTDRGIWVNYNAGSSYMPAANITLYARWLLLVDMEEIEIVSLAAGTFLMGSPATEGGRNSDEEQHEVTLTSGFYMGKFEVTQGEWKAVMGTLPSLVNASHMIGDEYPVYGTSWYDSIVFCNRLSIKEGLGPAYSIGGGTDPDYWGPVPINSTDPQWIVEMVPGSDGYRLPTEAQWEYACRAGTPTAFNDGVSNDYSLHIAAIEKLGWFNTNCGIVQKVGTANGGLASANDFGLYDMHGNLYEWCWDQYAPYPSGPVDDPTGPPGDGLLRVARGGSYDDGADGARSAARAWGYGPKYIRGETHGFRLLRPL